MKPPIFPTATLSLLLIAAAAPAHAQTITTENGTEFVTIGAVGNAPYGGAIVSPDRPVGTVNYEYRIARTEVTAGQWLEFANAYAPYNTSPLVSGGEIRGPWLRVVPGSSPPQFYLRDNALPTYATQTTWRMAARFCNWLHNGKSGEGWAFESGVYDTMTFGRNPETNEYTDQTTPSPGARFWIPSLDEWVKAAYFDPNKNGTNQPGYWQFPTTSDTAPITGLPSEGGQTSAGLFRLDGGGPLPVGAYSNITSPWGLFDLSGGATEITTSWTSDVYRFDLLGAGTGYWSEPDAALRIGDRIGEFGLGSVTGGDTGFRLAASIPTPTTTLLLSLPLLLLPRSRRGPRAFSN